ncbi:MAG: hypothetical protein ACLUBO_03010 [Coprococcus sp.]
MALFKKNFLHEKYDINFLICELQNITSTDYIKALYDDTITKINNFIEKKDYNSALRFVNFKGRLTKDLARKIIVDKYENRILDLIKKDVDLQKYILQTTTICLWLISLTASKELSILLLKLYNDGAIGISSSNLGLRVRKLD